MRPAPCVPPGTDTTLLLMKLLAIVPTLSTAAEGAAAKHWTPNAKMDQTHAVLLAAITNDAPPPSTTELGSPVAIVQPLVTVNVRGLTHAGVAAIRQAKGDGNKPLSGYVPGDSQPKRGDACVLEVIQIAHGNRR